METYCSKVCSCGEEIDAALESALKAVRVDQQTLTEEQKIQARRNLGIEDSDSGSAGPFSEISISEGEELDGRRNVTIWGSTTYPGGEVIVSSGTVRDGVAGKSAYAYAQEGGFTGTEAEFAEMMANGSVNGSGVASAYLVLIEGNDESGYRIVGAVKGGAAAESIACTKSDIDGWLLNGDTVFCVYESMAMPLLVADPSTMDLVFGATLAAEGSVQSYVIQLSSDGTVVAQMSQYELGGGTVEIPEKLPNPHALTINGHTYDGSEPVEVIIEGGSGGDTEMVLSDNLFDKSTAVEGKVFYYSSSGLQLADSSWSCYAYVPLRGPGTYRTKWNNNQHSSTTNRVGIVKEDNSWLQTINGTLTATGDAQAYDMEFVVTQTMINNGAAKIAFDCAPDLLDTVMIVKDREYPEEYIPYGYIEVATDNGKKHDNILVGKTAVFLGDSICAGTTVEGEYYNYGWAGLIGEPNRMNWTNYGMNGGTVTSLSGVQNTRWLTTQADKALSEHPAADYVIFEGGCNDADQMKDALLGTISSDYANFDTTTFSGAFEALVLKLVTSFPAAKIGYIIPQKMYAQNDHTAKGHVHRRFFDRAIEICKKWGIPYIDLWNGSHLNPKLSTASTFYVDGQHLTLAGYQVITPQIEAWMRNMWLTGTSAGGSSGGNVDLTGVVKYVNGQTPDENGNVEIEMGEVSDEQISEAVKDYLDEHPVATTAKAVKMSNILKVGTIFEKPEGLPYCGWPFNNVQYDPDSDVVVFLINAAEKHGDNGKNHLYMGKLDLDTYAVEIKEIGNPDALGHGFYTMGFCINDKGEYLYIDAQSQTLGKSTDKGETWTETSVAAYSSWPESITQLSNGRYLFWCDGWTDDNGSNRGRTVCYSDDDCATWTRATMTGAKYEGDFLELPDGVVMCFMRKSTQGTDNGAWNGTKIQEPIVISISYDYGTTWTDATDSTTLLEGCANIATAFYHKDEDLVEVFTSPRYPYGDTKGAIWQYIATREDALNDNFGTPKAVLYSKALVYQDFGHVGGCKDGNGDMHLMYYDGDSDITSGNVNYHYMKASRGQATIPVHSKGEKSLFMPYSANDTMRQIMVVRNELMAKINAIIIENGGTVDDPNFYVTDALAFYFDFTNTEKYDTDAGTITDTFGNVANTTFTDGVISAAVVIPAATFAEKLADKSQLTLDICVNVLTTASSNNSRLVETTTYMYDGYPIRGRQIKAIYTDTSGAGKVANASIGDWTCDINSLGGSAGSLLYYVGLVHLTMVMCADGSYTVYRNGSVIHTVTQADFASWDNLISKGLKVLYTESATLEHLSFRVYNKALTADEVMQNYNYAKSVYK